MLTEKLSSSTEDLITSKLIDGVRPGPRTIDNTNLPPVSS